MGTKSTTVAAQRRADEKKTQGTTAENTMTSGADTVDVSNLPAVVAGSGGMPDYLVALASEDMGKGVSTNQADNIVPLIYVIQPLSPQVDPGAPEYIEGARPGSIWVRNYSTPMVPGDIGILVQPCHFSKDWVEWVPRGRGGGYAGRFKNRQADAEDAMRRPSKLDLGPPRGVMQPLGEIDVGEDIPDNDEALFTTDPRTRQKVWFLATGNELVLTRNHVVRVHFAPGIALPYVIPLRGTGHIVSKEWMGKMLVKRSPRGELLPSWCCLYRLTTRQKTNVHGKWYQFQVQDAGYVDAAGYVDGKALYDAFETGEKVMEDEAAIASSTSDPPIGSNNGSNNDVVGEPLPF